MPSTNALQGRTILIVEDEYLIANDLLQALERAGARVIGPVATMREGIALSGKGIDAAVLDISLRGESAFPLADQLRAQGVPIVFSTGYDAAVIPERFAAVPRCEKPAPVSIVVDAMRDAMRDSAEI